MGGLLPKDAWLRAYCLSMGFPPLPAAMCHGRSCSIELDCGSTAEGEVAQWSVLDRQAFKRRAELRAQAVKCPELATCIFMERVGAESKQAPEVTGDAVATVADQVGPGRAPRAVLEQVA
jgi:hypothetical protein